MGHTGPDGPGLPPPGPALPPPGLALPEAPGPLPPGPPGLACRRELDSTFWPGLSMAPLPGWPSLALGVSTIISDQNATRKPGKAFWLHPDTARSYVCSFALPSQQSSARSPWHSRICSGVHSLGSRYSSGWQRPSIESQQYMLLISSLCRLAFCGDNEILAEPLTYEMLIGG